MQRLLVSCIHLLIIMWEMILKHVLDIVNLI